MAEIVNLNKARKQRARAEREAQVAANRVRHGRTRGERVRDAKEAEDRARAQRGSELDRSPEGE